ncbi:MAG: hypothetical protein MUF72_19585 [Elainella sp. Prado103]|jgi:hypothetical protein|nr:hypothetical protein [Elainella sp. Prado103]
MISADYLRPWCLICLQPNLQHQVLNRFQRRHEAEAHLKVLRQMMPSGQYMVLFDGSDYPADLGLSLGSYL